MRAWKYDGFISYSTRADRDLAPKIQEGLERLAKPWNRRKALKIFQDIDDLAANSDLELTLRDELMVSNTMIFLASRESARSAWCADELAYWIDDRPPEQLVVVLTDGTLEFDKDAEYPLVVERSSAAPPAFGRLRSVPLYIDMSEHADADQLDFRTDPDFRSKLTKISAAVHSNKTGVTVEPRDIDSRDLAEFKKGQRYRRIAVVSLLLLTIGAVLASILAVSNAQEAQRQRDTAQLEAANALARLGEASASDDMHAALGAAAEGYALAQNNLTEWTLLKLLLETRPLEWSVDITEGAVTTAVPVGDLAVYGTDDGAVSVVTSRAEIEPVVDARGIEIVDLTAAPFEPVVAAAWADGHVALIDLAQMTVLFEADWPERPTAVAPFLDEGPGVVVASSDRSAALVGGAERPLGEGVFDGTRVRVNDGAMTWGAFVATETDLATGFSFGVPTGGNRAGVWDAASGIAIWLDDRTPTVGVYPFDPGIDFLFGSDRFVQFEREQIPIDDVSLSGDGSRVGILSGTVLEVWAAGPEFDEFAVAEQIVLIEGVGRTDGDVPPRLELSHDGMTAVTSTDSNIRRWDVGRDVIAPEVSLGGAMDAYIGLHVTDTAVYWAALDGFLTAPAQLDLETYTWELLGEDAGPALDPVESDRSQRISPDGSLSASVRNGVVTVRQLPGRQMLMTLRAGADEGYLAFTPDGRHLVQASRGGGLQVWPLVLDELCPVLDRRVGAGTSDATCRE